MKDTMQKAPRAILLQLIASLSMNEHMGDVTNSIMAALHQLGDPKLLKFDDLKELRHLLRARQITTLGGKTVVA